MTRGSLPMLRRTMRTYCAVATISLGMASLFLLNGCETLQETTLEADRGTYFEAHRFLRIGRTTQRDVLNKYGKPNYVLHKNGTEVWYYRRHEAVLVNAYSGTAVGTESALLSRRPGFTQVVERTRGMDVAFGPNGVLRAYRVYRLAPPPPAEARPMTKREFEALTGSSRANSKE